MIRGAARDMVECHLSEEQQGRFFGAQGLLKSPAPASSFVVVGDVIQANHDDGILRGHGTQLVDGQLVATVCGLVMRVNKLIYVQHLRARYEPSVGDVVIGRVLEIAPKRWKVDIGSKHDAQLMLSAVNLPGGLQRRRTAVDELNMRELFVEGDLIIAELQDKFNLQTRSAKYGKLRGGQLIQVPYCFVKRLTQHFYQYKEYGVEMIFSCNGNVWVSALRDAGETREGKALSSVKLECRESICRLSNAVRVLSSLTLLISPDSVMAVFDESLKSGTQIKDMLSPEFQLRVIEMEARRRC